MAHSQERPEVTMFRHESSKRVRSAGPRQRLAEGGATTVMVRRGRGSDWLTVAVQDAGRAVELYDP